MVWMEPDWDGNDVNKEINMELVEARKRISELEADLEVRVETPVKQINLLEGTLVNKDTEIQRVRLEALRMRKEIEGLRSNLSSLTKEKGKEIARLEESAAWAEKNSREEFNEINLKNDKKIKALQGKIEWLNTTKVVAIPGLIDAMDHHDAGTQTIIARTLTELTGKSFGTDQEKWRKWWRKNRLNFIRR